MRRIALLALLALGAASCRPDASAPPSLAFTRCGEAELPQDVDSGPRHKFCAQIEMTEATGFKRVVQILVISDREANPLSDRRILVYHPGGPGISAVQLASEDPLPVDLSKFAILAWDGTTASQVPGSCGPASNSFGVERDRINLEAAAADVIEECLAGFGGPEDVGALAASEELEAIRTALGVEQFDILAVSYGTAIAEYYLRTHGASVGRAVLDGPIALEVPWAARVEALGASMFSGADALSRACTTARCQAVDSASDGVTYEELRRVLVAQPPSVGGGTTALTGTMVDQATLLALRSKDDWVPWANAIDAALGGDGTDLWALGEKEYFDLDRAVFYRSLCPDINLPPQPAAFGAPSDPLLRSYTSSLAPCTGFPHRALPAAPPTLSSTVLTLASAHDPLTPSALLDSAPELSRFGTICETDVLGHTSLRDPEFGPLALRFLAGNSPGEPC